MMDITLVVTPRHNSSELDAKKKSQSDLVQVSIGMKRLIGRLSNVILPGILIMSLVEKMSKLIRTVVLEPMTMV